MRTIVAGLVVLVTLSGCAPGLGTEFSLYPTPERAPGALEIGRSWEGLGVALRSVTDSREGATIVLIDGRTLPPAENIAPLLTERLRALLTDAGASVRGDAKTTIGASLEVWESAVTPAFPTSRVITKAVVRVQLFDSRGEVFYRGRYTGISDIEHPLVGEGMIREQLFEAIDEALRQFVGDAKVRQGIS